MRRISFMLRQVIACPSLPVTVRLLQSGGPGSCPQVAGPSLARPPSPGPLPGRAPGGLEALLDRPPGPRPP
jgi:hypothetical protein